MSVWKMQMSQSLIRLCMRMREREREKGREREREKEREKERGRGRKGQRQRQRQRESPVRLLLQRRVALPWADGMRLVQPCKRAGGDGAFKRSASGSSHARRGELQRKHVILWSNVCMQNGRSYIAKELCRTGGDEGCIRFPR